MLARKEKVNRIVICFIKHTKGIFFCSKYKSTQRYHFNSSSNLNSRNTKLLLPAFTLVEMVISIIIIGIISGVGIASILSASDALSFLTVRSGMDQSADVALSRMSREIRRVDEDVDITTATSTQLTFIDVDGTTITYSLSGTELMRTTPSSSDILASNVDSLSFTYYDDVDTGTTTPTVGAYGDIRAIEVLLTLQNGSYVFNYQSKIRPRNLRHLSYKF